MDRTPSDIELDEDSGKRRFDSHESLGFKQASGYSYTLPGSPTPPDLAQEGNPPSARKRRTTTAPPPPPRLNSDPPSAIAGDETSVGQIGDTSLASISLLAGEGAHPRKSDTTRVLEHAAEHEKLNSQSALSAVPPLKISHTQYPQYTDRLDDPVLAYTQVLVWCLQRRIERIERNPPQHLTTSRLLELLRVLKLAQNRLISGQMVPQLNTHDLLRLKPRMANPENERSAQIVSDLDVYRKRLLDQSRASWKLLKQAEDSNQPEPLPETLKLQNQYASVLEEARKENSKAVKAICTELVRLDSLNAQALAVTSEKVDRLTSLTSLTSNLTRKRTSKLTSLTSKRTEKHLSDDRA